MNNLENWNAEAKMKSDERERQIKRIQEERAKYIFQPPPESHYRSYDNLSKNNNNDAVKTKTSEQPATVPKRVLFQEPQPQQPQQEEQR